VAGFDFHIPNLLWVNFFFVQPELNPCFGAEFLIQLPRGGFVIAGVAEENAERSIHKDEILIGSRDYTVYTVGRVG
jgi:hypothetical protein